jgi:hypothetical protein
MPTYSQEVTVYTTGATSLASTLGGKALLPSLYNLRRLAPDGASLSFTGTGAQSSIRLAIHDVRLSDSLTDLFGHRGRWGDYTDPFLTPRARAEQMETAMRLFWKGNVIVISSTDYTVYARGSRYIERAQITWGLRGLFVPGNPDYYAPGS